MKKSNVFVLHYNYKIYLKQFIGLFATIYQYKIDIILHNSTSSMPHKNKICSIFKLKSEMILKRKSIFSVQFFSLKGMLRKSLIELLFYVSNLIYNLITYVSNLYYNLSN